MATHIMRYKTRIVKYKSALGDALGKSGHIFLMTNNKIFSTSSLQIGKDFVILDNKTLKKSVIFIFQIRPQLLDMHLENFF